MTALAVPQLGDVEEGPRRITEPGLYDIPAAFYHRDPVEGGSLSNSGGKKLLPPDGCPAKFRYEQLHGEPPKKAFDFGRAAHREVLGRGDDLVVVDADNWLTKVAKEKKADAYAAGKTPLLAKEYEQVKAMAAALREHEYAGRLFAPGSGRAEQTIVWRDKDTGVMRRARLDWLRNRPKPGKRFIIPDYKSAASADLDSVNRAMSEHGYARQAATYLDAVTAIEWAGKHTEFWFVFQEKTAPYVVTVARPDPLTVEMGRFYNRKALHLYRECVETGYWPGYFDGIATASMPPWAQNRYFEESGL